jgi:predicted neutral ceramidase superfamily lipid hydrolase
LYLLGLAGVTLTAWLIPREVTVVLQDFQADPRQILWGVCATLLPVCLVTRHDAVQLVVRRSLVLRRFAALALALTATAASIVITTWTLGQDTLGALTCMWVLATFAVLLSVVLGSAASVIATFVALLVTWVFGLDEYTLTARPWAVLLRPGDPATLFVSTVSLAAVVAWWAIRGSREL